MATIKGTDQSENLPGTFGNDEIWGAGGDDIIQGGWGDDILYGEAGNDYLAGEAGDDTMYGGDGADTIVFMEGDAAFGGDGDDYFECDTDGYAGATVDGGEGFDTVDLTRAMDNTIIYLDDAPGSGFRISNIELLRVGYTSSIYGGSRNDRIEAGSAPQTGSDFHGGGGDDALFGYLYSDTLYGDAGDDLIDGGHGNDLLEGGAGEDKLIGGGGDDTLNGGLGDDIVLGGEGWDTLVLSGMRDDYRVLRSGDDFIIKGVDGLDRVSGVELLRFSDGTVVDLARQFGAGSDESAGDDAFVLPPRPDDPPQVLPAAGADKFAGEPLVLPGAVDAGGRMFAGLEARLDHMGGWAPTLHLDNGLGDEFGRPGDWPF